MEGLFRVVLEEAEVEGWGAWTVTWIVSLLLVGGSNFTP